MIVHVTDRNIDSLWCKLQVGLGRALDKTALSLTWNLEEAYKAVHEGTLLGLYQPESGCSGLYSINHTPLTKVLYCFWLGKDAANATPVDFQEIDKHLGIVAEAHGCTLVNCEGRKGWRSVLLPLGYQEDSIVYSRGV